ncbi:hypothetical protein D3C87_1468110 [compost metagenome]
MLQGKKTRSWKDESFSLNDVCYSNCTFNVQSADDARQESSCDFKLGRYEYGFCRNWCQNRRLLYPFPLCFVLSRVRAWMDGASSWR